ncbi:MAG TPA: ABC transporter permease [Candidatus Acidoferrales bacterium]|nr:ABC transporter permease [Candidatus Acidoferrales bacterium]
MRPIHWLYTIPLRLRSLFRRDRLDHDLDDELRDHVDQKTAENVTKGLAREEARRQALLELRGVEQTKQACRDARRVRWLQDLAQDLRFALRMLRKSPGFTLIAVLTVALGIGASTAVFSLVDAVLLKPLQYPHANRIVFPWCLPKPGVNVGFDLVPTSRVGYLYLERHATRFESVGAFESDTFNLTGAGEPVRLDGMRASAGFFPSLGVAPAIGRVFTSAEDRPGNEHEVILSYGLWRSRFGGDPAVLGRAIELNGAAYTVIGVMPPGFVFPRANEMPPIFAFPREAQIWVPLALNRGPLIPAEPAELAVVARLRPRVTVAQAQDEMNVLSTGLERLYPAAKGWFNTKVTPLAAQLSEGTARPLLLTLAAVGVLLLLACANVAGLLITRALGRKREFTLRAALGAQKSRLLRQLLTESFLLSLMGALGGLLVGEGGIYLARHFGPSGIPRLNELGFDFRVLAFALGVMVAAAVVFGLAPVVGIRRERFAETLKEGGQRAGSGPAARRARNFLLVSQIALAVVLVSAAGLLTRTFYRLLSVNPGFRPDHVLTFELSLSPAKYPDQTRIVPAYQEILRRIRELPGVKAAGITEATPMAGAAEFTGIRMPGEAVTDPLRRGFASYTMASPGYFTAVGAPILHGRDFLPSDTANSQPVTIISESMARKFWPGKDPLGQEVGPGSPKYPLATIIGIVPDTKRLSLRETPLPEMYVPYTQKVWPSLATMDVIVRTAAAPSGITASVGEAVHAVDPDLPLANVKLLSSIVAASLTAPRFSMLILVAFGVLALVLAGIGMYGVISHGVAQRTREIGIRMALGAQRGNVFGMVLTRGAGLTAIGLSAGIVGALVVGRLMSSFLFGVKPADPLTLLSVILLLLFVTFAACYIPARRAMRVDPVVALRHE